MYSTINRQREVACWIIAFALHFLLLFWTAQPFKLLEDDPIISIDLIIEQIQPLGSVKRVSPAAGGRKKSLLGRIKKLLGFSQKVLRETKRSDQLMTGDLSQKIQSETSLKDFKKEDKLVSKKRTKSARGFEVKNLESSSDKMADVESSNIAVNSKRKLSSKIDKKLSDKQYRVSGRDLPFEVARAPKGKLATGSDYSDAPSIVTGRKTDRGVYNVSKTVAKDKGSFSGSSSGSGSLSGAGGFSGIAPTSSRSSSGSSGGGLSGASTVGSGSIPAGSGAGRSYGGTGSRRGFSGAGSTSGGVEGGELGEGTQLATGSGGKTGTKKGGGGSKALFELSGPLSNRKILRQVIPKYPDWAKKKGIFASVSLRFWVLHTGVVKNTIVIVRTSGYPKLDNSSMDALIKWKFAALSSAQYGKEQWGIITFKFKVR